jgi:hypothetical protein
MNRRAFLASLGLAPLVARSYFDMGPSWQRHDSGLVLPHDWDVWLTANQNIVPTYIGKASVLWSLQSCPSTVGNGIAQYR